LPPHASVPTLTSIGCLGKLGFRFGLGVKLDHRLNPEPTNSLRRLASRQTDHDQHPFSRVGLRFHRPHGLDPIIACAPLNEFFRHVGLTTLLSMLQSPCDGSV
jgi:hypothetical protein